MQMVKCLSVLIEELNPAVLYIAPTEYFQAEH
jgi:hypothetical protein